MITLSAQGIRALWEPGVGHLPELVIDGAPVLYAAPWRDEAGIQTDPAIAPVERRLGGTFACCPFGGDDVDGGPIHGQAANGPWTVARAAPSALTARCALSRGRMEARIILRDDHPVLYQTHVLDLSAPATFAHHPMLHLAGDGHIATAPLRAVHSIGGQGDGTVRPLWSRDARSEDDWMPTPTGPRNWRDYPGPEGEDFLALVTHARTGLSWTAVQRRAEGDTILFLKRAEQLPLTCLWMSNGGRDYAPWNGRYRRVLGVEDAICAGADGFAAALSGNSRFKGEGIPQHLPPGRHVIPHAIVRLAGCHLVRDVTPDAGLRIMTEDGPISVPFATEHFA